MTATSLCMSTLQAFLDDPDALGSVDCWTGIDVNYETPRVKRLWRPYGDGGCRVYLHEIEPCREGLYHPHPWASAMFIAEADIYMTGIGSGDPLGPPPPKVCTLMLSGGNLYEMTDPLGWHYVAPRGSPAFTVMVTEKPWAHAKRLSPPVQASTPLLPEDKQLLFERFGEILAEWREE